MKSTWQKIYSFFGFWTYTEFTPIECMLEMFGPIDFNQLAHMDHEESKRFLEREEALRYTKRTVIYWCCLPSWTRLWWRKFDLFSWEVK